LLVPYTKETVKVNELKTERCTKDRENRLEGQGW
jgi:hypothetical protein